MWEAVTIQVQADDGALIVAIPCSVGSVTIRTISGDPPRLVGVSSRAGDDVEADALHAELS